jgi:geranylgeranyl diphosphate synthase type II
MKSFDINTYLKERKELVDKTLDSILPEKDCFPPQLHNAMRYCLFSGGKRLRPILALAAAEAVGEDHHKLVKEACSLELIHTYTLIHDDLPSMDNDDYRRGYLTTHKVFGEAIAVLAGDALQTEAFSILSETEKSCFSPEIKIKVIRLISAACGSKGIIGGQTVDLESEGKEISMELLDYIHTHKTAALITASVLTGAVLANADKDQLTNLNNYGEAIGLAFQITDDILDITSSTEQLGKTVGKDQKMKKATYPSLVGLDEASRIQQELYKKSIDSIRSFDINAKPLREIARLIIERKN